MSVGGASQGFTLWLTGCSGAGKSTLASALCHTLIARGHRVEVLDGDEVRKNLSRELGFSKEDRDVNVRRIGFVARLLSRNGAVAIVSAISPYRQIRNEIRQEHEAPFIEVFVQCALSELVRRDVKGLYAKALNGTLPDFTGVSAPYEAPLTPEVNVKTDDETVGQSLTRVLLCLEERGLLGGVEAPALSAAAGASSRLT